MLTSEKEYSHVEMHLSEKSKNMVCNVKVCRIMQFGRCFQVNTPYPVCCLQHNTMCKSTSATCRMDFYTNRPTSAAKICEIILTFTVKVHGLSDVSCSSPSLSTPVGFLRAPTPVFAACLSAGKEFTSKSDSFFVTSFSWKLKYAAKLCVI